MTYVTLTIYWTKVSMINIYQKKEIAIYNHFNYKSNIPPSFWSVINSKGKPVWSI